MKVRIWDEHTGNLVGSVELRGFINIIWFAPSFTQLMTENDPGHYAIAFQAVDKGAYLMTHSYLGIPSLPYGSQDKEPHEA